MKFARFSHVLLPGTLLLLVTAQPCTSLFAPALISVAIADAKSDAAYRKTIENIYIKRNNAIKARNLKAALIYEHKDYVAIDSKGKRSTKKEADARMRQSIKVMPPATNVKTIINKFKVNGDEATVDVTNIMYMTVEKNGAKRPFVVTNKSRAIWVRNKNAAKGGPAALIKQSTTLSSTATIGERRVTSQ